MGGNKLRIVNPIKPKHHKCTSGVTGTNDRDKYNRSVIDPYDHEPLQGSSVQNARMRTVINGGQIKIEYTDVNTRDDASFIATVE